MTCEKKLNKSLNNRSASSDHESRDVKSKLKAHTSTVARGKSDGDGRKKSAGTKSEVQVNSKHGTIRNLSCGE